MKTLHELALTTKQLMEFKIDKDGNPINFEPRKQKMWHITAGNKNNDLFQHQIKESFDSYEEAKKVAREESDFREAEYTVWHGIPKGDSNKGLKPISTHKPRHLVDKNFDPDIDDYWHDEVHTDPKSL